MSGNLMQLAHMLRSLLPSSGFENSSSQIASRKRVIAVLHVRKFCVAASHAKESTSLIWLWKFCRWELRYLYSLNDHILPGFLAKSRKFCSLSIQKKPNSRHFYSKTVLLVVCSVRPVQTKMQMLSVEGASHDPTSLFRLLDSGLSISRHALTNL